MANDPGILNLLQTAARAEGARQKAIANNIANLNTPGYRRSDVRFEELLTKAIDSEGTIKPENLEPEYYKPLSSMVKNNGNDVSLDTEVGEMVKNSLRHKTFMLLLKKKYRQMEAAIRF